VIHARDKRLVGGDAFVDDKLKSLEEWSSEHPRGLAILWREPHNETDATKWPSSLAVHGYLGLTLILEALRRLQ